MKCCCSPKHLAELVGTFGLTLAVSLSLVGAAPVATPVLAALTVGIFVYTIGGISGCHINPAVTVGLWSIRKIAGPEAGRYIAAQFAGAVLAMAVAELLTGQSPSLVVENSALIGLAEMLGAGFLVFGVCAVAFGKVTPGASGVTIGGSLFIGIAVAAGMSNGVLNPAVALGIGSFSLMYVVGPLLGGILAAQLYRAIAG